VASSCGMARLLPFRAVTHVSAPPTSGPGRLWHPSLPLSEPDRRAMLADDEHGLHLAQAPDPRARLRQWLDRGILRRDDQASFHVLEVSAPRWREGPARFLLGALAPREDLMPLEAGQQATSAPWVEPTPALAADDHRALRDLIAEVAEQAPVVLEGTLEEGRRWRLLRQDVPRQSRRLQTLLDEGPLRPLLPLSPAGPQLAAVLPLSESGWRFRPVHRAIQGLATFREDTFLQLVSAYARVLPLDASLTSAEGLTEARERLATLATGYHAVLMVLPEGRGRLLRFRQGLDLGHIPAAPRNPTLRSLDLALLNSLVLRTVLGLQAPEATGHPNVFTVSSLEQLVEQVQLGIFQAGFALNPPPTWEVRAVMEAHATLPPRTLRLDPLPPAGLLFLDPDL
jgi:hypothetical protein